MVVADSRWVDWNWEAARPTFLAAIARGADRHPGGFLRVDLSARSPLTTLRLRPSWALKFTLPNNIGPFLLGKRAGDIVGSALLLLPSSPISAAAAVLIAILDGLPIFYRQPRAGFLPALHGA